MENNQVNNLKVFLQGQDKDKHFQVQKKRVFIALYKQPKTMLMVSVETGILRANICRYVAEWRKRDCIKIVKLGICPISKRGGVQYLTTNPETFPAIVELSNTVKL